LSSCQSLLLGQLQSAKELEAERNRLQLECGRLEEGWDIVERRNKELEERLQKQKFMVEQACNDKVLGRSILGRRFAGGG
jgi:hypothetical protein